ncbi:Phosphotransferase enzyme family protein [Rubripirellula reticaptiva]|uniref:Phosphotransferase enzyme family protein n=2 Tax=Rubripirellula reticaptiva TaxID=2528013 RepID=A0A5C6FDT2_9BACT|nr:Phosphotransferase enzyme family protein [Rubripirellula reticaptiva]
MIELPDDVHEFIRQVTGASSVFDASIVQSLWSGYGQIYRVHLVGSAAESVIVKHVRPPSKSDHPRGWDGDQSHQRKLRSYEVELHWYRDFAARCDGDVRVPHCYGTTSGDGQIMFVLEDLDAAGYPLRRGSLNRSGVTMGLRYLANFHATFLGVSPTGLWKRGTYWHLETRPDELAAMGTCDLKRFAADIDSALNGCRFQTLVHGDAKVANFCFSADGSAIAAVDFQYVGGGCGMKDVAYFLGSCQDDSQCERDESLLLDTYFEAFHSRRAKIVGKTDGTIGRELESEWRSMYPVAWADFTRFMLGWCPGHSKLTRYSHDVAARVVEQIRSSRSL